MSTLLFILLGLVLCFAGGLSVHLAVAVAGFAVGWLLATVLGAGVLIAVLVALACALAALIAVRLLSASLFFVAGIVVGAVVGTKLFLIAVGLTGDWLLSAILVPVVAVLGGWLVARWRRPMLRAGTAAAGAALVLSGLGRIDIDGFLSLGQPQSAIGAVVLVVLWVALAELGRQVQSRWVRGSDDAEPEGT